MAENLKQSNIRRKLGNRIIVIAIIAAIMVIPCYLGIGIAFVMYYGDEYSSAMYDPPYLFTQYGVLFDYWQQYKDQLPDEFSMKLVGPPALGFFFSLFLLFLVRAPLLDFRPFKA